MTQVARQGEGQVSSLQKFKSLLGQDGIKKKFDEALGKKAPLFISNLVTIASGSAELQKCEHMSIISSALMAASMDLPLTPGLGFAGIVPYYDSASRQMKAQFQVMKKGYIQLAQRTGLFKTINVTEVYEGELTKRNKFTGEYEFDEFGKKSDTIIGYVSYFKLVNGFEKYMYMPIEELDKHASKYSKSFQKGRGKWADKEGGGYEQMCEKTVLKLNLSTYAPLSTDINMMNAVIYDQAEIRDTEAKDYNYMDNEVSSQPTEKEVLENPNGTSVVIDKGTSERSSALTSKASQKIDKLAGKTQPIQSDEVVEPIEEVNDLPFDPDPQEQTESQHLEESFEQEKVTFRKVYKEEELNALDQKDLVEIVMANEALKKAMLKIPGKNTHKKLKLIILMDSAGKLDQHVESYSKSESAPEPKQVEMPMQEQAPLPEEQQEETPPTQQEQETSVGNKFNIEIPEIEEGGVRGEEDAERLYDSLGDAGLTNKKYRTLQESMPDLAEFRDKEDLCFSGSSELINHILSNLEE